MLGWWGWAWMRVTSHTRISELNPKPYNLNPQPNLKQGARAGGPLAGAEGVERQGRAPFLRGGAPPAAAGEKKRKARARARGGRGPAVAQPRPQPNQRTTPRSLLSTPPNAKHSGAWTGSGRTSGGSWNCWSTGRRWRRRCKWSHRLVVLRVKFVFLVEGWDGMRDAPTPARIEPHRLTTTNPTKPPTTPPHPPPQKKQTKTATRATTSSCAPSTRSSWSRRTSRASSPSSPSPSGRSVPFLSAPVPLVPVCLSVRA